MCRNINIFRIKNYVHCILRKILDDMIGKFYFIYTEQIKEIFIQKCRYCLSKLNILDKWFYYDLYFDHFINMFF